MTYVDAACAPLRKTGQIKIHGAGAFEGMRKAGQLTARALDLLVPMVRPGVTTASLDKFIFEFGRDHDAYPAPLHYRGYRKSICTSINRCAFTEGWPATYMRLESPCQPSRMRVTSIFRMSPSLSGFSSGMPWQTT